MSVSPGVILFYCSQAPSCGGGQTPICDMRKVYRSLFFQSISIHTLTFYFESFMFQCRDIQTHRDCLADILDKGVRYCRSLPSSRSTRGALYNWEKTFRTEDKLEVESLLLGLGYEVEWREGKRGGWRGESQAVSVLR